MNSLQFANFELQQNRTCVRFHNEVIHKTVGQYLEMTNYKLNFISKSESLNSLKLPNELVDSKTSKKFGNDIKLIWRLYRLKNEKISKQIQKDEQSGIFYSEINIKNLKSLTEFINAEFLSKLLDRNNYFNLKKLNSDSKYSLSFSLESEKNVVGIRGMKWSNVNVISFSYSNNKWIFNNDNFWNYTKWSVIEFKEGYCEIKTLHNNSYN
ncbi:hypothetical protein GTQ40_10510 [Flavobacteriaceae bacterium R38]|nr:hypothetical protein [Flavobacteriaceae bacterium R38]